MRFGAGSGGTLNSNSGIFFDETMKEESGRQHIDTNESQDKDGGPTPYITIKTKEQKEGHSS